MADQWQRRLFSALCRRYEARTVSLTRSALHYGIRARAASFVDTRWPESSSCRRPALLSQRRHGAYIREEVFRTRAKAADGRDIGNPAQSRAASNYATSVFQEGCRPRRTQFEKNHWLRGGKSRAVTVSFLSLVANQVALAVDDALNFDASQRANEASARAKRVSPDDR